MTATSCASCQPRFARIGTDRLRRNEVQVPLDWKAKSATHRLQLGQAHIAQFWKTLSQVAEPECMVVVMRIDRLGACFKISGRSPNESSQTAAILTTDLGNVELAL